MTTQTVHFYVLGRVQGVGYRVWTVRTARQLHLSGWVRNRINGHVEILAQGSAQSIELFQNMCLTGPAWSRVRQLQAVTIPDTVLPPVQEGFFEQKPTV
ncbi:MAG: acylphosphatase [Alphaproteobacteria bacterium]|nr:acylphosphatase [Alphaproteobacteria bacterium]